MIKDEFLFHYGCEWDTYEFLGWDEVWICIEQLYGGLQVKNEQLKNLLSELYGEVSYERAGEWVIDDEILQKKIRQVLDGE